MKIQTYTEAVEKLFQFEKVRDYSLERMNIAMEKLNNPLKNIKIIHVAGTNGKGSVCKMVFGVLKHCGKSVGCFTSPHLVDIRERFVTDSGMISEDEFLQFVNIIEGLELGLSYFEKCCLIGFLLFEKREVEYAIVEVGFGGLLDSTNVVSPIITAITSIGLDHTDFLGNTLDEISFQKAGIIKEGIPVVYNHENSVIEKIAKENNAPVIFTQDEIETNLVGVYQKKNAAIAFEICTYVLKGENNKFTKGENGEVLDEIEKNILEGLQRDENEKNILEGLQRVEHLGRLQYVSNNLLIDGAHNIDGLRELSGYLESIKKDYEKIILCIAQKKGKKAESIIDIFGKSFCEFICVDSENKSFVVPADELVNILENNAGFSRDNILSVASPDEIFELSQNTTKSLFVVFGSLYMIGDFLKFVSK